jgi:hypothetical protein
MAASAYLSAVLLLLLLCASHQAASKDCEECLQKHSRCCCCLVVSLQAASKDGKSANRLTVMLRLLESTTGSLAPLLALRSAGLSSGDAAGGGDRALLADKQDSDSDEDEQEGPASAERRGRAGADSPELHDRLDSRCGGCCCCAGRCLIMSGLRVLTGTRTSKCCAWFESCCLRNLQSLAATSPLPHPVLCCVVATASCRLRVEQWVSNSFNKREPADDDEPPAAVPRSPRGKKWGSPGFSGPGGPAQAAAAGERRDSAGGYDVDAAGAHGYVEIRMPGRAGAASKAGGGYGCATGKGGDAGGALGDDAAGSVAGSESQSAGGSEALDAASSVATDVEDELVADWR